MRVLISHDLEGVTGIVLEPEQTRGGSAEGTLARAGQMFFDQSRKFCTGDINAAARGALKAGADEIFVLDEHGGWGQNLIQEELVEEIRYLNGRAASRPLSVMADIYRTCDALFLVGLHPMRGTRRGVIEHTFNPQINVLRVNGKPMGEIGINAAIAGYFGVPIVFISGCDGAVAEAKDLFGDIEAVEVKKGLGRTSAILLPPRVSWRQIEEGSTKAIRRLKEFEPFKVKEPTRIEVEFQQTGYADAAEEVPYVQRIDGLTLSFEGPFLDSYKAFRSMMRQALTQR